VAFLVVVTLEKPKEILMKALRCVFLILLGTWSAPQYLAGETPETSEAFFAGGCFWCMEPPFESADGVMEVISGYSGGNEKNPTYEQVASGKTSHIETIKVIYDPSRISFLQLLDIFWRNIDPTDAGGQFVDRGRQYRSAIFVQSEDEKRLAEQSKIELSQSGKFPKKEVVTDILDFNAFYPAEDYHQDYYKKNPLRYKLYRLNSGRDQFLERIWGPARDIKR
jgi:peptide methionine sulfoxide reductase msrA/msrB